MPVNRATSAVPREVQQWFERHIKIKQGHEIIDAIVVREERKLTMCGIVTANAEAEAAEQDRTLYLAPAHVFELDDAFVNGRPKRGTSPYAARMRAHARSHVQGTAIQDDRDDDMSDGGGMARLAAHDRRASQSTTSSRFSELAESVSTIPTVYSPYLGRSLSTSHAESFDLDGTSASAPRHAYQLHGKAHHASSAAAIGASITHATPAATAAKSAPALTMATPIVRVPRAQPLQLKERVVALLDLAIDSLACADLVLLVDRSDTPTGELQTLLRDLAWVGFLPIPPIKAFHEAETAVVDGFVALAMEL